MVLQIVNQFSSGGIRAFLLNYYRNISKQNIEFYFLVQRDYYIPQDKEIEELGGKVVLGPKMYGNEYNYYVFLKHYIKSHPEIDAVHSHLNFRSIIPLFAAKHAGIKKRIAHSHKAENNDSSLYKLKRILMIKLLSKLATVKCACSIKAAEYLFGSAEECHIIRNAINVDDYAYDPDARNIIRAELNIDDGLVIGHIGNFSKEKNHSFILEVFEEALRLESNLYLVLIGDGEYFKAVTDRVKGDKLLNNRVILLGQVPAPSKYYSAFDVFLFPSLSEGFGMVLLEAQCAGLPVLVSKEIESDAIISDSCKEISLSESSTIWAKELLSLNLYRNNNYRNIYNSGYDIASNLSSLLSIYLS